MKVSHCEQLKFQKCKVSELLRFGLLNGSNNYLNPNLDAKEFRELDDEDEF